MIETLIKPVAVKEHTFNLFEGVGKMGRVSPEQTPSVLAQILSRVIGLMTVGGLFYFLFQMMIAGYNWIAAGGDAQKVKKAQDRIWQSFLGIGFVIIAVAFVSLLGYLMGGVDFLDLQGIINQLTPK